VKPTPVSAAYPLKARVARAVVVSEDGLSLPVAYSGQFFMLRDEDEARSLEGRLVEWPLLPQTNLLSYKGWPEDVDSCI
jgi:hypothetical protein